jgi:hypothetical protein
MSDTITFRRKGSTMTVTAHPTATAGLIVHDQGPLGGEWRLTHEASGHTMGEFAADEFEQAQDAAAALNGLADWTGSPAALQDEAVIWKAIDAIEYAGGRFLCRRGGLGERVAAKRTAYLTTKGN